jgi:hypothetical protein
MKFSTECSHFLQSSMRINVSEFELYFDNTFGDRSNIFDYFVKFMINDSAKMDLKNTDPNSRMKKNQEFRERCFSFLRSHGSQCGALFDYAYIRRILSFVFGNFRFDRF